MSMEGEKDMFSMIFFFKMGSVMFYHVTDISNSFFVRCRMGPCRRQTSGRIVCRRDGRPSLIIDVLGDGSEHVFGQASSSDDQRRVSIFKTNISKSVICDVFLFRYLTALQLYPCLEFLLSLIISTTHCSSKYT